jgi:hypothetical protein
MVENFIIWVLKIDNTQYSLSLAPPEKKVYAFAGTVSFGSGKSDGKYSITLPMLESDHDRLSKIFDRDIVLKKQWKL